MLMEGDTLMLSGSLTSKTVSKLFSHPPQFEPAVQLVDLNEVVSIDSAGLALLVHWSHEAEKQQSAVKFINTPQKLKELAVICSLGEMFV